MLERCTHDDTSAPPPGNILREGRGSRDDGGTVFVDRGVDAVIVTLILLLLVLLPLLLFLSLLPPAIIGINTNASTPQTRLSLSPHPVLLDKRRNVET